MALSAGPISSLNAAPPMPWETCRPNESDERIRILDRLATKLLDNRVYEEREKHINELARQETELEHLRNSLAEHMKKHEDLHLFVKGQEATIQQLKQQMIDRDFKQQDSSKCNEALVQKLKQQLTDLQLEKTEEARKYDLRLQRLEEELQMAKRTAMSNAHANAQAQAQLDEIHSLRSSESSLKAQLAQAQAEVDRLKRAPAVSSETQKTAPKSDLPPSKPKLDADRPVSPPHAHTSPTSQSSNHHSSHNAPQFQAAYNPNASYQSTQQPVGHIPLPNYPKSNSVPLPPHNISSQSDDDAIIEEDVEAEHFGSSSSNGGGIPAEF